MEAKCVSAAAVLHLQYAALTNRLHSLGSGGLSESFSASGLPSPLFPLTMSNYKNLSLGLPWSILFSIEDECRHIPRNHTG